MVVGTVFTLGSAHVEQTRSVLERIGGIPRPNIHEVAFV